MQGNVIRAQRERSQFSYSQSLPLSRKPRSPAHLFTAPPSFREFPSLANHVPSTSSMCAEIGQVRGGTTCTVLTVKASRSPIPGSVSSKRSSCTPVPRRCEPPIMSAPGVLSFTQQGWEQVLAKVKWALVYLDAACAESLHWGCGSTRLLEAVGGPACHLREFEPAAVGGGAEQPKAVFVLSCLLKGRTVETLRDIICRSHFQYCVVVTAVNHAVHLTANHVPAAAAAELEGQPVFEQLEEKLCEWMGNMNYTAEVLHVPLLFAPVAPHLALTPAFASLFPLLPQDVHLLNSARPDKRRLGSLNEVDASALPPELLLQIRCLVSGLSSLCEHLGVREECFAVGSLSRIIAADLANYGPAKNRRKTATGRASVVFVDRTLDLTGKWDCCGSS